ncbi:hypothetical protein MNV49_007416 [Pseudohyphozyma bogoriensis]|nr:hypothetical protein MNV49_007416 [Pseudohyphozyma bogoriensis]
MSPNPFSSPSPSTPLPIRTLQLSPPEFAPAGSKGPLVALARSGLSIVLIHAKEDPEDESQAHGFEMIWLKTYSENKGIMEQLQAAGWIRDSTRRIQQGYVSLPMVEIRLHESEVSQQCPACEQFELATDEKRFKRCGKCKKTYYCSEKCQTDDWKIHKTIFDAFTSKPFSGNSAAVVLLPQGTGDEKSEGWHLRVAKEFNFSETAFLTPLSGSTDEEPHYRLRWFTPTVEFPLCGHATLASSYFLFTEHHPIAKLLKFDTMSGTLTAALLPSKKIELNFPADISVLDVVGVEKEEAIMEAIRRSGEGVKEALVAYAKGKLGWIIELKPEFKLKEAKLDSKGFAELGGYVMYTQPSAGGSINSRVLDPVEDIQEDPVTGSAHCMLAPYWLERVLSIRERFPVSRCTKFSLKAEKAPQMQGGTLTQSGSNFVCCSPPDPDFQPGCTQAGTTVTCSYTSGVAEFVVPLGIDTLTSLTLIDTVLGGQGAQLVFSSVPITGIPSIWAVVAGNGVDVPANADSVTRPGGANGGGVAFSPGGFIPSGASGGGSSDIRTTDPALGGPDSRLYVAAFGGDAGLVNGANGGAFDSGNAGAGGTQTAAGGNGVGSVGGTGSGNGGGGGGGYFGGGGGALRTTGNGKGGGGGSSFVGSLTPTFSLTRAAPLVEFEYEAVCEPATPASSMRARVKR